MNVLITYATKYGSTAKVAETIGDSIRQAGFTVDVTPVSKEIDPVQYDATILGSAVYMGRWLSEAVAFLKQHKMVLTEKDVWFFSSGPTGEGDPAELLNHWNFPKKLMPYADHIQPNDMAVFHGRLALEELTFLDRVIIKNVQAEIGDFRDWEMIETWADKVVTKLSEGKALPHY